MNEILLKKKKLKKNNEIIAIDPGEKIFLAGYGIKNYIKIDDSRIIIKKRLKKIDKLQSKKTKKKRENGNIREKIFFK